MTVVQVNSLQLIASYNLIVNFWITELQQLLYSKLIHYS